MAFETGDDGGAGAAVAVEQRLHLLGVEPSGERGRVDEVDERHRHRPPFERRCRGVDGLGGGSSGGAVAQAGGCTQETTAMSERQAEPLEVEIGQLGGRLQVDIFAAQCVEVPFKPEAREPRFEIHRAPCGTNRLADCCTKRRARARPCQETLTPFQNATRPLISRAASLGSG